MSEETRIDRLRDWLEGRLSPERHAEVERDLAEDPELARLADSLRDVNALTRGALGRPAPSALRFEDLPLEDASETPRRWVPIAWAAAAVLLLAVGAALLFGVIASDDPEPVRLAAIELEGGPALDAPPPIPPMLATFRPVAPDGIQWITTLAEGRGLSRVLGRPLLVFGMHPTCPWCLELRRTALSDESVLTRVTSFVPVTLDISQMEKPEYLELMKNGWPYLEIQSADGETVLAFHGRHDAESFAKAMDEGLATAGASADPLPWDRANQLAALLVEASEASGDDRLGEAYAGYRNLVAGDVTAFQRAGEYGIFRIAEAARRALVDARSQAEADVPGALAAIEDATRRFEGTPYAVDLAAVGARMRETGRFPELEDASS